MTTAVKRSVPPPTLVKMGNPLARILLGSPLHGVLDGSFLALRITILSDPARTPDAPALAAALRHELSASLITPPP